MIFERLTLGSILFLLILLFSYNYASNMSYYMDSPVIDISTQYSENQIFVIGLITGIYSNGFEVYSENRNSYKVKTNSKVSLGHNAYILGILDSDNEIIANKVMTTEENENYYVIFRSLIGLIIFLLIFRKYWKFKLKKMLFIRRN